MAPEPDETEELKQRIREAGERARSEAEARRTAAEAAKPLQSGPTSKEVGGRDGPEPVRYGDWENKGIASDF